MIDALKKIIGGSNTNYKELVEIGAIIIDVRSAAEYAGGHVANSINIPLDQLDKKLNQLDKKKPIITCCASGMRSGVAKGVLKSKGFEEVYNGGGWMSLNGKLVK
ncbi:rhodanese-like domain-containing protein [Fulvivirga lutea]|uniref:Rhodanese-like domain-containing protein n=1 Tax=Fulvivirga lutea TaxID=2810512 RepID=A0A974WL66_9BACT|nr:rhodanese-like domain-containing protein [Fulvivirga lutea]QSE99247.1 rhodanese-like domain-containing protein [Fulvivirga lutea]